MDNIPKIVTLTVNLGEIQEMVICISDTLLKKPDVEVVCENCYIEDIPDPFKRYVTDELLARIGNPDKVSIYLEDNANEKRPNFS